MQQFHTLYEKVFELKSKTMRNVFHADNGYYQHFKNFNFSKLHSDFKLIEDNDSQQLFIPIQIPVAFFENISDLEKIGALTGNMEYVDGEKVFEYYERVISMKFEDFTSRKIEIKKLGSIMSQFSISIYSKQREAIGDMLHPDKGKYGFEYLLNWANCYSPEYGFDSLKIDTSIFL